MQLQDAEVTEECREKFRLLCKEFEDVFSKDSTDIGRTPLITMDIDTGDSPPVCQKPYNLPLKHREWVQKKRVGNCRKGWRDSQKYLALG